MADSERHLLAPSEKETLEDVLKYGSTADVARMQHVSAETVRLRVKKAMELLIDQVAIWKDSNQKILELEQKIKSLEDEFSPRKAVVKELADKIRQLEMEVIRLRNLVKSQEVADGQPKKNYVLVDPQTKKKYSSSLEEISIPSNIIKKLNALDIYTVFDLIRITESKLSRMSDISIADVNNVVRHLKLMGLRLGTDVKWSESYREYYVNTIEKKR